jgi:hypothetical protein
MTYKERKILLEANDLLRSAYSIASRDGSCTRWPEFRKKLLAALVEQNELFNGTSNDTAATCTARTFRRVDLPEGGYEGG